VSPEVAKNIYKVSQTVYQDVGLADGTLKHTKVFREEIYWLSDKPKEIDITIMDPCPHPLLGFPLLKGTKIVLGQKRGYVKSLSWIDWPIPK
jgi:hypothetical protein